jgi:hypothetical protein
MPEPLNLSTKAARLIAASRALDIRMAIRAGQMPPPAVLLWLCDVAYTSLLACEQPPIVHALPDAPDDLPPLPAWLTALPDPQQES